ncbi:MAG: peptidoglycan editing factor PgeF [Candidatus Lernaella stagnicola]|nr:peptidoglycan editing factor PgeF [Candidatus Lernaella stagnicola]
MPDLPFWRSALLESAGYRARFFGREGGVSEGHFRSLNLSAREEGHPDHLAENERRVLAALETDSLYLPAQVHGKRVRQLTHKEPAVVRGSEGDAVVTGVPGQAIGVLTADCVPILIGAVDGRAAGVIHAGWRSLLAGIIGETVERLTRAFSLEPGDVAAAVGPAIGPKNYEVNRDLALAFLHERFDLTAVIWPDRRRKPHMDLRLMAVKDLLHAGLVSQSIEIVGPTTFDERLFSHRRDGGQTGRQLSAIVVPGG